MSTPFWTDVRGERAQQDLLRYDQLLKADARRGIRIDLRLRKRVLAVIDPLFQRKSEAVNRLVTMFVRDDLSLQQTAQFVEIEGKSIPGYFDARSGTGQGDRPDWSGESATYPSITAQTAIADELNAISRDLKMLKLGPRANRHVYGVDALTGSMTGRPSYHKYLFAKRCCLRQLVRPEARDHVLVNVDAAAMDIGMAAGLTKDPKLIEFYRSGDPYAQFESLIMSSPVGSQLQHLRGKRRKWKRAMLSIGYGIMPAALAVQLGTTPQIAQSVLCEHTRRFPVYWSWVRAIIEMAYRGGWLASPSGWMCHVPTWSHESTWQAWPFQASAADICRKAYLNMTDAGVPVLATLHDGFYFSLPRSELAEMEHLIGKALDAACDKFMPSLRLTWRTRKYEGRLSDGADDPAWRLIMGTLEGGRS